MNAAHPGRTVEHDAPPAETVQSIKTAGALAWPLEAEVSSLEGWRKKNRGQTRMVLTAFYFLFAHGKVLFIHLHTQALTAGIGGQVAVIAGSALFFFHAQ